MELAKSPRPCPIVPIPINPYISLLSRAVFSLTPSPALSQSVRARYTGEPALFSAQSATSLRR
jgi:hypothetical protein